MSRDSVEGRELAVGQVAEHSGVAVSASHSYETEGLITSWRTEGNQRRYPREVLRRVAFIRASQEVDIPLRGINRSSLAWRLLFGSCLAPALRSSSGLSPAASRVLRVAAGRSRLVACERARRRGRQSFGDASVRATPDHRGECENPRLQLPSSRYWMEQGSRCPTTTLVSGGLAI